MSRPRALPLAVSTLAVLVSGCGATSFPGSSHILGVSSIDWDREAHPMAEWREIRFESDAATSTLYRLDPAGTLPVRRDYFDGEPAVHLTAVCTAPCTPTLRPAWYIVTGGDLVHTHAFQVPFDAGYVRVKAGGSQTLRELGIGGTFVGAVLLAIGGVAAAMSGTHDVGSVSTLALGAAGVGLGLPLWLLNPPTRVAFGTAAP